MRNLRPMARGYGLPLLVSLFALGFGVNNPAWAQAYPPNGPDIPTITLNEGQEGAAGLRPLPVPHQMDLTKSRSGT
jgi:hypothetical protein